MAVECFMTSFLNLPPHLDRPNVTSRTQSARCTPDDAPRSTQQSPRDGRFDIIQHPETVTNLSSPRPSTSLNYWRHYASRRTMRHAPNAVHTTSHATITMTATGMLSGTSEATPP